MTERQDTQLPYHTMGLPGQFGRLSIVPVAADGHEIGPLPGRPGPYRVVVTLKRPGYALTPPAQFTTAERLVGDSALSIGVAAAPEQPRARLTFEADTGVRIFFDLHANAEGMFAKLIAPSLHAPSLWEAERMVYSVVAPFLSELAVQHEVPLEIGQIDVTEINTGTCTFTYQNAFPTSVVTGGFAARVVPEQRGFTSVYREALTSNSPQFQFLCFFKILEQLAWRRGHLGPAVGAGERAPFERLVVPHDSAAILAWLRLLYPALQHAEDRYVLDIVLREVWGRNVTVAVDEHLRPIRDRIAHCLFHLEDGAAEPMQSFDNADDLEAVRRWLPTIRTLARWQMRSDLGVPT